MTLAIRRLWPGDTATYRAIRLAALAADPDMFGASHAEEAARPDAAMVDRLASSTVLAAFRDGTPVGMAAFKRCEGAKESHKGFVWGVFVRPAHRGTGVAPALMTALLDAADDAVEQLTLTITAGNAPAAALYRRFGFTVFGTEPRAFRVAAGYCDSVLMVRLAPGRPVLD